MENNNNNINKQIQNAAIKNNNTYSKKYYIMFFIILVISFLVIFWLCNYTKLKEMFQIITLMALSIAIAEYTSRKYFNK